MCSKRWALVFLALSFSAGLAAGAAAQTSPEAEALGPLSPFEVEGYYRIRWGHQDEFLALFQKNHWPVLQAGIEAGAILEVGVARPHFHAAEKSRWDFRVTIVWRNALVATSSGGEATAEIVKRLFPDQEAFAREERRRFELIEEHTDVPVVAVDTAAW
jgi:hypothetical protein